MNLSSFIKVKLLIVLLQFFSISYVFGQDQKLNQPESSTQVTKKPEPNFREVIEKKIKLSKNSGVRACNERLDFETAKAFIKLPEDPELLKQERNSISKTIADLVTFCSQRVFNGQKKYASKVFVNTLVRFISKLIKDYRIGLTEGVQKSLDFIFIEDHLNSLTHASQIIRSIDQAKLDAGEFEEIFDHYVAPLANHIFPSGNVRVMNQLLSSIRRKPALSSRSQFRVKIFEGLFYFLRGEFVKSKNIFQRLVASQSSFKGIDYTLHLMYAQTLRGLGDYGETNKYLMEADKNLSPLAIPVITGWLKFEQSKLEFSMNRNFDRANALLNESATHYRAAGEQKRMFTIHLKRGEYYRKNQNLIQAEDSFNKAKAYLEEFKGQPLRAFEYYYQMAVLRFKQGRLQSVRSLKNEAVKVMRASGESKNCESLFAPLIYSLLKDQSKLSSAVLALSQLKMMEEKKKDIKAILN